MFNSYQNLGIVTLKYLEDLFFFSHLTSPVVIRVALLEVRWWKLLNT
jgi:hypothetical protein